MLSVLCTITIGVLSAAMVRSSIVTLPPLPLVLSSTQTFHGGQDWAHLSNFVEDFSVTTNGLGTPEGAVQAAYKAVRCRWS